MTGRNVHIDGGEAAEGGPGGSPPWRASLPTGRPRRAEHSVPPGRIQYPTCDDCGQMVPNGFSGATCHKGAKEMCAPPPE